MFQTAELGQMISKPEFKQREAVLRTRLLKLQRSLGRDGSASVIIDFAGVSGGGKSTSVNLLNKWMDPRWIHTHGYFELADTERQRPEFWRFWRDLPPRGQIGIFLSGRYSRPLLDYVHQGIDANELKRLCERINRFEAALADDGALVLKFWMHLNRDVQEERLKRLEKDPLRQWRVKPVDWENWELYDRFIEAAELIISRTNTGKAPWVIVDSEDYNYRSLAVGERLLEAMDGHLRKTALRRQYLEQLDAVQGASGDEPNAPVNGNGITVFDTLDLSRSLEKSEYKEKLRESQARLAVLHGQAVVKGKTSILVFEGPDASGKGGAIRRMVRMLDARTYSVQPIAAPTDEEIARQYLWRFWRRLPRAGRMTAFDRSWYGRVLVERIEGLAHLDEWQRAYSEINDFEEQLVEHGFIVRKFWLHLSKEEQLRRFEAREKAPHKQWKLTDEDWRNREKWSDYKTAAHEMIQRTSTAQAPWTIVECNDKLFARVKVIETVCDALEAAV